MTSLALCLLLAATPALPDTFGTVLVASGSGSVGYTETADTTIYVLTSGTIHLVAWDYVYPRTEVWEHGWLRFDLESLPDSAEVFSARLRFFQSESATNPPACQLTWLPRWHSNPESLFSLVTEGVEASGTIFTDTGWNELALDSVGVALLNSRLVANIAEFGLACRWLWRHADYHGVDAPDSLRPRLVVDYSVGVAEPAGAQARPGDWAVASPCAGRLRLRAEGEWRIRDAGGRVVLRGVAAGRAEVDLSALPAGVYTVECRGRRARVVRP